MKENNINERFVPRLKKLYELIENTDNEIIRNVVKENKPPDGFMYIDTENVWHNMQSTDTKTNKEAILEEMKFFIDGKDCYRFNDTRISNYYNILWKELR